MKNRNYAYLFAAKSIQKYLFSTGKLKDMIGGSELIDYICAEKGMLDKVLENLNLRQTTLNDSTITNGLRESEFDVVIARKAGGVFIIIFNNPKQAKRFISIWKVVINRFFYKLETLDLYKEYTSIQNVITEGLKKLFENQSHKQAYLPASSPITHRYPRTGNAISHKVFNASSQEEWIDETTYNKRTFVRPNDNNDSAIQGYSLLDKFLKLEHSIKNEKKVVFPNNFDASSQSNEHTFPLTNNLIALVHADGNGLGQILRVINDACDGINDADYLSIYKAFSEGVTEATINATQKATETVLLPELSENNILPARPLVLGGDDLSVIIRADLAVAFTKQFLRCFEEESTAKLKLLRETLNEKTTNKDNLEKLPTRLTACAGIVFMHNKQPFQQAYNLSEALCKKAKTYSKKIAYDENIPIVPSSLAFYHMSNQSYDSIDDLIENSLTVEHKQANSENSEKYRLSQTVYLVESPFNEAKTNDSYFYIEDLMRLSELLQSSQLNERFLRNFNTTIHTDINVAKIKYRRWLETSKENPVNMKTTQKNKQQEPIVMFLEQLSEMIGELTNDLPVSETKNSVQDKKEYLCIMEDIWTMLKVQQTDTLGTKK